MYSPELHAKRPKFVEFLRVFIIWGEKKIKKSIKSKKLKIITPVFYTINLLI